MTEWTDRYWTSGDGLRLHYRDYDGPADRLPLLCLHGLTRNGRDFEALAGRYAGQRRLIVPDFRGRGLSDHDPDTSRYLPPTYAADILQLLALVEIGQAVFVATSLGGIVTMIIATAAPDRIAAVILNDVGPELSDEGIERIKSYVGKPILFADWADAAARLRERHGTVHPGYDAAAWDRYARRVCRETERGVEFDYDMGIADNFQESDSMPAPDVWPFLRALAGKPVLLVRGANSDLLTPDTARRMVGELPGAELVTVPGVGHAPDLDEPEVIAGIDRLLERVG